MTRQLDQGEVLGHRSVRTWNKSISVTLTVVNSRCDIVFYSLILSLERIILSPGTKYYTQCICTWDWAAVHDTGRDVAISLRNRDLCDQDWLWTVLTKTTVKIVAHLWWPIVVVKFIPIMTYFRDNEPENICCAYDDLQRSLKVNGNITNSINPRDFQFVCHCK